MFTRVSEDKFSNRCQSQEDIYDEFLTLFFLEYIREEKKFRDLDLLRRRLIIDKLKVKGILEDGAEL